MSSDLCKMMLVWMFLIDCAVFNAVCNIIYVAAACAPIHAFVSFILPVLRTILFPSYWLLSYKIIVETMHSGERRACCAFAIHVFLVAFSTGFKIDDCLYATFYVM